MTVAKKTSAITNESKTEVVIKPPNFKTAEFRIVGTAAYVQNKFSVKAQGEFAAKQAAGQVGKNTKQKREPKDFNALYEACQHRSADGWHGIPASAFRSALAEAMAYYKLGEAKWKHLCEFAEVFQATRRVEKRLRKRQVA
jgi:hypothetical protein